MDVPIRTGIGYDIHRTEKGRPLILAGVRIASEFGLSGHSDADVISHAIADAILGAAGLPDIGHYFPPSDASIAGIDSQKILSKARSEVLARGFTILNIDAVLIAEKPRILPYVERMKSTLSETLGLATNRIGLKATTHEGLGPLGRGEGMAAQATCLLGEIN